jgi:hypothetical protein
LTHEVAPAQHRSQRHGPLAARVGEDAVDPRAAAGGEDAIFVEDEAVVGGALDGTKEVVVSQPAVGEERSSSRIIVALVRIGSSPSGTRAGSRTAASASP